jgi:hypothetical protein
MRTLLAAVTIASLVSLSSAHAQGRPDFSGTWKMDASRSESASQAEPIGPVTLVIVQTPNDLKIDTTRTQGTSTATYKFDGSKVTVSNGTLMTHWDGVKLVTEGVFEVSGAAVTMTEIRTLAAGGDEMLVDRSVVVQHGYPDTLRGTQNYVAGKDVYVKVK